MTIAMAGTTRDYHYEDRIFDREGGTVCQALLPKQGFDRGNRWCLKRTVEKKGRYKLANGWWDVWECSEGHLFAIRRRTSKLAGSYESTEMGPREVVDVTDRKVAFGEVSW